MENNMKKMTLLALPVALLLFTGCAPKTYISTSPLMAYDLTDVNITTLKTSKVCLTSENTDVSVRHAAEIAKIKHVYAVDNHTVYETHLFSGPTVKYSCIIVYGSSADVDTANKNEVTIPAVVENKENNTTVKEIETGAPVSEELTTDTNSSTNK